MTASSVSASTETLKQLNAKIDELRTLLNTLTPVVDETKSEPELVIKYYDTAKTKKHFEYYLLNGKRHGKSIIYYQNGHIQSICNYVNDKINGISIVNNEDGSVKIVRKFENGVEKSTMTA